MIQSSNFLMMRIQLNQNLLLTQELAEQGEHALSDPIEENLDLDDV